jgi:hypothetical protein
MNTWVKGLIAALITGAANAVLLVVVDPVTFPLSDLSRVGTAALTSAVVATAAYLAKSPIPTEPTE